MVTSASATINLEGGGSLPKLLADLNKEMGSLNKVTATQATGFKDLNKVGKQTTDISKTLLDNVKELYSVTRDLTKGTKDTFSFLTETGKNTIALNDALEEASTGTAGFGLKLVGLKDDVERLNSVIDKPAGHFRDIAEAEGLTAKAFVVLDKTSKPVITSLNFISNQLEKAEAGFRQAEVGITQFSQTAVNLGAKSLLFFSQTFEQLSENIASSGFFGKIFASSFSGVAKTLEDGARSAEKFSKTISPDDFVKLGKAGDTVSEALDKTGKGLDRLAVGVRLADKIGDVTRFTLGIKDSAEVIGEDLAGGFEQSANAAKVALPLYLQMNGRLQLASQAASAFAKVTGNQLVGALGLIGTKLTAIGTASATFIALGKSAADAYVQTKGLADTFDVMQRMGIDTTAASIAFQFGIVGEKLLFSSEAAKEFAKTSITAFTQLEDAAAFVTTLGSGGAFQLEGYEAGVESISAAMSELVSGPLKNTVTSLEATNALYNSLSAGVGTASDGTINLGETTNFLSASLKLAAGAGADTAQTLELLAKTSKVYGISNSEAATTAAKLYQIVEQGIVTFPQLTGQLGRTLSVAKATGVSIDEASGSVAALTKVMSADDAQTGFASLLQSIAGQGEQAQNALKELGIRFDVNSVKSKGLINSLNELYEATGGNASALKEIIPDALAFQTALTLMTSASKDAAKITSDVANSGEEMLDKVFESRQQSTIQQFSMIMNGFNEVLIDFGRRALPAIQPGVDFLQTLLNILQSLPEPIKNLIGGVVLAQTAISNIGGGLLSFGLSLAQIIASLAAFRLASKLLGGQLGKEIQVIREINENGVDFAGTLLRLIGLNESFDASTAAANNTLKRQKEILSSLARENINFEGPIESSKGLNSALKATQERIKEVRQKLEEVKASGSLVDVSKTERELTKLVSIEKKIVDFKKRVSSTKGDLFGDLQKTVDVGLSSAQVTLEQRTKSLKEKLDNYFKVFGETGDKYRTEIQTIFRDIVSNNTLSPEQKIEAINASFKKLGQGVAPDIKKQFDKVQEEFIEGIQRLDGNFSGELSKVKDRLTNSFSNLISSDAANSVRGAMEKVAGAFRSGGESISGQVESVLSDPVTTIETKIYQINELFDRIGASSPAIVKGNLNKLKTIITDNLLNIAIEVEQAQAGVEEEIAGISETIGEIGDDAARTAAIENLEKLRVEAAQKIEQFKTIAIGSVEKANSTLKQISESAVVQEVDENLRDLGSEVKKQTGKIEGQVTSFVSNVNTKLEDVGDERKGLGKFSGLLGSVGDLLSNIDPRISNTISIFRDFGDVAEQAGVDGEFLQKAQQRIFKQNIGLDLSLGKLNKNMFSFGKGTKGAAGGVGIIAKTKLALAGATKVLAGGLSSAGLALKSLIVTLGPFIGLAAIAASGVYLIHNALKVLIPAYGRATDGNLKLADSMSKTDEQVKESTETIKKMTQSLEDLSLVSPTALESFASDSEKAALADLSNAAISGLTGATDAEITKLRESVIEAVTVDEKSFVQGWRAPLVSLLEFVNSAIGNIAFTIQKLPLQLAKGAADALSNVAERVPLVGGILEKTANSLERALFGVRKEQAEFNKENRKAFNQVRDNIQAAIAKPAREAALESREAVTELLLETNKLSKAYTEGGVAFGESQDIVKKAAEEQRALRGEELQQILADEQELNTKAREEIQKNIEAKQAELDKAKDPVVREELQSQIDALEKRNQELEEGLKLQQQYLQNTNEILNARDTNRAETGADALQERTQQIFDNLSEEGKKTFLELGDLAVDAEGRLSEVPGNLVNSSQRRAEAAFQGARAGFIQTLEDIDDPTKEINADKIATDLFGVLESVDAKVAEGVIDFDTGERLKEQYQNLEVEITDQFGNVQKGLAKEFLRPQQVQELERAGLEALRNSAAKAIEIKEGELKEISALESQNLLSGVDAARQTEQANSEIGQLRIEAEQRVLNRLARLKGADAEETKAQARALEQLKLDIAVQGFNDRKKVLDSELSALQAQKDNEIKAIENAANKEKGILELKAKSISLDQSALQAQQELTGAIANLEATNLQNKLKFTGDIVEKAEIELELAKDRQAALAAEQEFEKQNLEFQQQLNAFALEREGIELRVQKVQLETQKILAEAKLAQADSLNLTEREREALQLQVDSISQQVSLIGDQEKQLVKQGQVQEVINQKQRDSLQLRQEAAKQTSAAEVELANLEKVNAGYEKQKEILRNNAREVEVAGEERLQNFKSQEDILNAQTQVYQKQLEIIQQTQDISQRFFDMAKSAAMSSFRQRRIEKEAAQERLKNLEAVQKIEQVNLQIQQQQRDLALARREIELDVAEAKQVAALAEAEAEAARLEADPRATAEQRRAAQLGIQAQRVGLEGISSQREALGIERALNEFVNVQERQQQEQQFGIQRLEAEQALAATTLTRSDDRRIGNRALSQARSSANQVESLIQQFSSGTLPPVSSSGGRTNSLGQAVGASSSSNQSALPAGGMMSLGGKVEIVLNVKGDTSRIDREELQRAASEGIYQGLNQLFEYSINRTR